MTTVFDPDVVKLGKAPKKVVPETFMLASYIDPKMLAPAPSHYRWDANVSAWPMYGNDRFGDCVFAEIGHHIQSWTAAAGHEVDVTEQDILNAYAAVTGFNPQTGANDNGTVVLDALNYWRKTGIAGHKIGAFADVDVHNHALVKDAIYLFDGLSIGMALPLAAQHMGKHWVKPHGTSGDNAPGSWGGHCTYAVDYDRYAVTIVTWGELVKVAWAFWDEYVDECWAAISTDFLNANQQTPQGFNIAALQDDLRQVGHVH